MVVGTQKVWLSYQEQKDEILALLERAEEELNKVGRGLSAKHVAEELKSKQVLSVGLREATETMLRRLQDFASGLAAVAAPDKKTLINKEVSL